jgi:hypothetical protein
VAARSAHLTEPRPYVRERLRTLETFDHLSVSRPLSLAALQLSIAEPNVLTRSYDYSRTGWYQKETKMTQARDIAQGRQSISLAPGTDDPRIEAQPLYVPGIVMADGKKRDADTRREDTARRHASAHWAIRCLREARIPCVSIGPN